MLQAKPKSTFDPIDDLEMQAIAGRVVEECVRAKLFDRLREPRTVDEIAESLTLRPQVAEGILDLLCVHDLLRKDDGRYSNTLTASEFLVSDSPFWQGTFLLSQKDRYQGILDRLANQLQGRPGPVDATQGGRWASVEAVTAFGEFSLQGSLQDMTAFITATADVSAMRRMADIGGNHGRYTMALLDENPSLVGDILDMPSVVPVIREVIQEAGYGDRLSAQAFDLRRDSLPEAAYDLVLISHVLHIFSQSLPETMKTLARGVAPGGWLVSQTLNPKGGMSPVKKSVRKLTTCLMGVRTHWLTAENLETMRAVLTTEGFGSFTIEEAGPDGCNVIFAARKER